MANKKTILRSIVVAALFSLAPLANPCSSAAEPLQVGETAPDFKLEGLGKEPVTLSELQGKEGKHVVLVFTRGHW